jgi:hypothetical protein
MSILFIYLFDQYNSFVWICTKSRNLQWFHNPKTLHNNILFIYLVFLLYKFWALQPHVRAPAGRPASVATPESRRPRAAASSHPPLSAHPAWSAPPSPPASAMAVAGTERLKLSQWRKVWLVLAAHAKPDLSKFYFSGFFWNESKAAQFQECGAIWMFLLHYYCF